MEGTVHRFPFDRTGMCMGIASEMENIFKILPLSYLTPYMFLCNNRVKIKEKTLMSDMLVIEIVDSDDEPRCSLLWEWGYGKMCRYSAYLAHAIGSLDDDSTTDEIVENILEVFPKVGIPRKMEFYKGYNLGMAEYALSTQYADDLGVPDGNILEGLLAVSRCSMDKFASWANSMNYLYLGNVTMKDCLFEEDLEEYCGLYFYEEGGRGYKDTEAEIEAIKKSAFHVEDKFLNRRITTKKEWEELLEIINKHEWIEHDGNYYLVK